ncbi:acetylglutamate kinase [Pacificimonas sp. WHA3]|uniref:Acetylglutamate kinase n=2 Tax=Pacificimonas pallii TaxID=2827236 RepID=A0ABS6SBK5_9SPHN|nr:acetylglutamate kinase [Pacificimonas pallii]
MLLKAETLTEALPYIQKYEGRIFVVKYGGHAMGDAAKALEFAQDIVLLKTVGIHPVVVHGGGPQIGEMLSRVGVESQFIDGLRVTDAETAKIAEMVLGGSINKEIVRWIGNAGGRAVGLSGKDDRMVIARKLTRKRRDPGSMIEQEIDLGFVGEPVAVNRSVLDTLIADGIVPVIAPVALGENGDTYNVNADTMAGAIAGALDAARLMLLTDVPGVLAKDGSLLTDLHPAQVDALIADGTITGGMIPKLETCLSAIASGVGAAVILNGRTSHGLLLEIFTRQGAGTLVKSS